MSSWRSLADVRREYGDLSLEADQLASSPFAQFKIWFETVLKIEKNDPTAMTLSTVDDEGRPDSRMVLLKGFSDDGFVFYTNYQSPKAMQLNDHPFAALNFYWPEMARQVRVRGRVKRLSKAESDTYFATRPVESQISAIASHQSTPIPNREALESVFNALIEKQHIETIVRPEYWGGYKVIPDEVEFWQGRDHRLHDRFHYHRHGTSWVIRRLSP